MRGLRSLVSLVLGTGVVLAACDRDEESGGLATAPSLASVGGQCSATTINRLVRTAFTDTETRGNVQGFVQDMAQAFGDGAKGRATWFGFQVLQAVDTAGRFQGGAQASSDVAVATLPCMSLGSASLPTSLVTELGTTGAFGVRGRPTADFAAVIAHNGTWILEPPEAQSWQSITTLQARTGITGDTAKLFLALGKPGSGANFTAVGDQLIAGSFDWTTVPTATFDNPYVVVGQCVAGGGFLQHFPASDSNAEIFGFVQPTQCPASALSLERAPRSMAERLFRALSPAPAYATALLKTGSGGGSKPALSPFAIINPGKVNLGTFSQSPKRSGNVKNQPLTPKPIVEPKSNGGLPFKQTSVLVYLTGIVNNGTPGVLCFNWSYNDDEGEVDFPHVVYTKAGGLSLVATSKGTQSTPEPTGQPVPVLQAGTPATSSPFNVKNAGTELLVCPVFDGQTYFTNIFDPAAAKFTFDPDDASTFPPNYDVVTFPGYQFQ